mmetsp:Transcript_86308/g.222278  ORF Transcript_86308/g.222278 Transcript_86308/m.222278 type:complete len:226 (-) Transcript_86308:917-1594(-)
MATGSVAARRTRRLPACKAASSPASRLVMNWQRQCLPVAWRPPRHEPSREPGAGQREVGQRLKLAGAVVHEAPAIRELLNGQALGAREVVEGVVHGKVALLRLVTATMGLVTEVHIRVEYLDPGPLAQLPDPTVRGVCHDHHVSAERHASVSRRSTRRPAARVEDAVVLTPAAVVDKTLGARGGVSAGLVLTREEVGQRGVAACQGLSLGLGPHHTKVCVAVEFD